LRNVVPTDEVYAQTDTPATNETSDPLPF